MGRYVPGDELVRANLAIDFHLVAAYTHLRSRRRHASEQSTGPHAAPVSGFLVARKE